MKKPINSIGNILIYDDKNIKYYSGILFEIDFEPEFIKNIYLDGQTDTITAGVNLNARLCSYEENDNIKLDDTTMKRIAKFNKEQEIKRLDKKIEDKKNTIKELDDILQDKEKRLEKLKEFVANLYEIDVNNNYEDDDEYYD